MLQRLKDYSALMGPVLAVVSLLYTYSLDRERSRAIFTASCYLVRDGKVSVDRSDPARPIVSFETRCAVRNLGYRSADIAAVRNAVVYNADLAWLPGQQPEGWERPKDVSINGKSFAAPVNISPGSQASVEMMLGIPVMHSKFRDALGSCRRPITNQHGLIDCLRQRQLFWTDYLQSRSSLMVVPAHFNGMAALFMLSDGTHVFGETQFRDYWVWRCPNQGRDVPHYMTQVCTQAERLRGEQPLTQ